MINHDDVEVLCRVSIVQFGFTGTEATLMNILQVVRKKNQWTSGCTELQHTILKSISSEARFAHSSLLAVHIPEECTIIGNQ